MAYILTEQRNADPRGAFDRYREYLAGNGARFPPSAYALATSHWYFDVRDHRCPHDAWLESALLTEVASGERSEERFLTLTVRLLGAYHDGHIELRYARVLAYELAASSTAGGHRDWRYDELRVDEAGLLVHEIEWSGPVETGRWRIVASDVELTWIPLP